MRWRGGVYGFRSGLTGSTHDTRLRVSEVRQNTKNLQKVLQINNDTNLFTSNVWQILLQWQTHVCMEHLAVAHGKPSARSHTYPVPLLPETHGPLQATSSSDGAHVARIFSAVVVVSHATHVGALNLPKGSSPSGPRPPALSASIML